MPKKTELREAAYEWIEALHRSAEFAHTDLYKVLEQHFPLGCSQRGDAAAEPRYRNDARWAAQDAKRARLIRVVARGRFERL